MKKPFFALFTCLFLHSFFCTIDAADKDTEVAYQMGGQNAPSSLFWLSSYDEAVKAANSSHKPIFILFTGTSWCPACKLLERNVLTQQAFSYSLGSKFIFLKAEFQNFSSNSPYKPLLDRYLVNEFPSIVVVSATGEELFRVSYRGNATLQSYVQEIEQKLSRISY